MIAHDLDAIAEVGWVIAFEPHGGTRGAVLSESTPEVLVGNARSHTGRRSSWC